MLYSQNQKTRLLCDVYFPAAAQKAATKGQRRLQWESGEVGSRERCAGLNQSEAGREHGAGRVFADPASPSFLAGSKENRKHEEGLYLRETKIKKCK